LRWLPGISQILFHERSAKFAGSLATLVEWEVPLDQALQIAGEASGDRRLAEGARSLAAALHDTGQFPHAASDIAKKFPPFLKWAIWDSNESTGRIRALQIAARTYRDAAARRRQRLQTLAPICALLFVGGIVTFLYCLALFVPVTEMLRAIAAAPSGTAL
jgi:type II secretory pathway component PulF